MKRVKMGEDGLKVKRVTGSKTVGEFREGEAVTEERVFNVSVIEGREEIKDGIDLLNAFRDDLA